MNRWPPRRLFPEDILLIGACLIFLVVIAVDIAVLSAHGAPSSAAQVWTTPTAKPGAMSDAAISPTATAFPSPSPQATSTSPTSHAQPASPPQPTQPPASQPTQAPQPNPTQPPAQPSPSPCANAVNGNPWCYTFSGPMAHQVIYNPNAAFCDGQYFTCVSDFWTADRGYVVECANGVYSHSGGVSGACSRDGGVSATLYQP